MKKFLSMLLALVMVLGMAVPVFAANISGTVSGDQTWNNGDTVGTTTISGGTITVNGTVTVNGTITITGNVRITGGGKLLRGNSANTYMISVTSGSLTLDNITLDGNGDSYNGKGVYVNNDAKLTINEGAVLKNHKTTDSNGSVMRIEGQVVMNGGVVENNKAYNYGNIYLDNSLSDPATFTMNGGTIRNNNLTVSNGSYGGGAFYVRKAIFTMNGGTISGHDISADGGAIYCTSYGKVYLNGGSIENNTTTEDGDAIYFSGRQGEAAELYIGGNPYISDAIYLYNSGSTVKYPYITSAIKNPLTLEVTAFKEGRVVAEGTASYQLTESDMTKVTIKAGNDTYYAKLDGNQLVMTAQKQEEYIEYYYITYLGNGGAGKTLDDTAYRIGDDVVAKANEFTREGYTFDSWNTKADGSGTRYIPGDVVNMTGDITLYAQWTPDTPASKTYTVTYKADGNVVDTQTVDHGADAVAPTVPEKEGYNGAWDKDGKNITADTIITAVYTAKTYTITAEAEEGGNLSVSATEAEEGDEINVSATAEWGYLVNYIGYKKDGDTEYTKIENGKFTMPASDVYVKVFVEERPIHTVTFDANGGECATSQLGMMHGTRLDPIPVATREGYTFDGWFDQDGVKLDENYVFLQPADFVARYTENSVVTHTVTFVANGEVVEVQEVEHGKDAVMPEVPALLLCNGKWDHNGKNITSDLTITAEYALIFDAEDVIDFVTEITEDEEPEEAEVNPSTGAPVFAPVAVLAAAAVVLGKKNK